MAPTLVLYLVISCDDALQYGTMMTATATPPNLAQTPQKPDPDDPDPTDHVHVGDLRFSLYYHTMSNYSVFDRLSNTPTRASSARDEMEKAARIRRRERAAREAALDVASPSPRGDRSPGKAARSPPPSPVPKRTPRQLDDFFGRICKQETVSSAAHHADAKPQDPHKGSAEAGPNDPPDAANLREMKLYLRNTNTNTNTNSPLSRTCDLCKCKSTCAHAPITIQTEIDLSQCNHHQVRTSLQSYSHSKLSARSCCIDIIEALFRKEYAHRPRWEVYPGEAEGDHDALGVWHVEKKAIKDWKGSFGVASARAKIRFVGNEVFVEDYVYTISE